MYNISYTNKILKKSFNLIIIVSLGSVMMHNLQFFSFSFLVSAHFSHQSIHTHISPTGKYKCMFSIVICYDDEGILNNTHEVFFFFRLRHETNAKYETCSYSNTKAHVRFSGILNDTHQMFCGV